MPKIVRVGNLDIHCLSTQEFADIPRAVTKRISCTDGIQCRFPRIFSRDNLGALDNYAKHEKLDIYFSELENDLFDNTHMVVFKKGKSSSIKQQTTLNLNLDTREGYVDSIRKIYNFAAEAVKNFAKKK